MVNNLQIRINDLKAEIKRLEKEKNQQPNNIFSLLSISASVRSNLPIFKEKESIDPGEIIPIGFHECEIDFTYD